MRRVAGSIDTFVVRLVATLSTWLNERCGLSLEAQLLITFLGLVAWLIPIYVTSPWQGLLGGTNWLAAFVADVFILVVGIMVITMVTATTLRLVHSWLDAQAFRREQAKQVSAYTAWSVLAGPATMVAVAYFCLQPYGILHTWQEPLPFLVAAWHAFAQRGLLAGSGESEELPDGSMQLLRVIQHMREREEKD
jgi:hypothetical protein